MRKHAYFLLFILAGCTNNNDLKVRDIPSFYSDSITIMTAHSLFPLFSDSARDYKTGDIPYFFYNYQLDYQFPWRTDHRDWSLRKRIFDVTDNISLLTEIVNSPDPRLKKIVEPGTVPDTSLLLSTPYHNVSNYELAKRRLKELQKK